MKALRYLAIGGALMVMLGETYRSWGMDRPIVFVLDDMLAGAMMISAAVLARRPSRARRAYFAAAWGVAVGMSYGSFFGKLIEPDAATPGNFSLPLLTALVGLAFAAALLGLLASILLPDESREA